LYPAAILLHVLIGIPAALVQVGVLTYGFWTEALVFLIPAALVLIAVYTHRKLKPAEIPVIEDGNADEKV
jgi:uncharacterized membrane protein YhfC